MNIYDSLADRYDGHFRRPVDRWEDDYLTGLLRPHVDGRDVLDLGCGTGWLADHCRPARYTGVDTSAGMLAVCATKHPEAHLAKVQVGTPGWWRYLPDFLGRQFTAVTAIWCSSYLGDPVELLHAVRALTLPGSPVILHGMLTRRRAHYIGTQPPGLTPAVIQAAAAIAGWPRPHSVGCGALPDRLTGLGRRAWHATLATPVRWHYSAAHFLVVPR